MYRWRQYFRYWVRVRTRYGVHAECVYRVLERIRAMRGYVCGSGGVYRRAECRVLEVLCALADLERRMLHGIVQVGGVFGDLEVLQRLSGLPVYGVGCGQEGFGWRWSRSMSGWACWLPYDLRTFVGGWDFGGRWLYVVDGPGVVRSDPALFAGLCGRIQSGSWLLVWRPYWTREVGKWVEKLFHRGERFAPVLDFFDVVVGGVGWVVRPRVWYLRV